MAALIRTLENSETRRSRWFVFAPDWLTRVLRRRSGLALATSGAAVVESETQPKFNPASSSPP
jgi:hypothetical protein